jgi:hypothetical protein
MTPIRKAGFAGAILAGALAVAPQAMAGSVTSTPTAISFLGDGSVRAVVSISAVSTEPNGDHVFRISPATAVSGPACAAAAGSAICNDNASSGVPRTLSVTTGSGDDVVTSTAPVPATYRLGAGDDTLSVHQSLPETSMSCGAGYDVARIDLKDPEAQLDCEDEQRAQVDMHPIADVKDRWVITKELDVTGTRAFSAATKARVVKLRVACPRVKVPLIGPSCDGRLSILTKRGGTSLGARHYTIPQGRSGTVLVRVRHAVPARAVAELVERQTNGNLRTTLQQRR